MHACTEHDNWVLDFGFREQVVAILDYLLSGDNREKSNTEALGRQTLLFSAMYLFMSLRVSHVESSPCPPQFVSHSSRSTYVVNHFLNSDSICYELFDLACRHIPILTL